MTGSIIWLICVFLMGIIFYAIGAYAEKKKTPMWFITGGHVSPDIISDVKEYNRENAKMWRNYSLPFFAAGVVHFYSQALAVVLLVVICTAGIGWLFWTYKKIFEKYKCAPKKRVPSKKKKK